jgi:hypothetical protein
MLARDFVDAMMLATPQPMAVINGALEIQQANAPFATLFSESREQLRGRRLDDLTGTALGAWRLATEPSGPLTTVDVKRSQSRPSLTGRKEGHAQEHKNDAWRAVSSSRGAPDGCREGQRAAARAARARRGDHRPERAAAESADRTRDRTRPVRRSL